MVGRLEARKNQLAVLRALRGSGVPVTIVGAPNPRHRAYVRSLEQEIRSYGNASYIPEVDHEDMHQLYLRHAAHINASWYEVAPLVDLEAAAASCAVVASRAGYTGEYLGDAALYVEPDDEPEVIRSVILNALKDAELLGARARARVQRYTWAAAARDLLEAYRTVLDAANDSSR